MHKGVKERTKKNRLLHSTHDISKSIFQTNAISKTFFCDNKIYFKKTPCSLREQIGEGTVSKP